MRLSTRSRYGLRAIIAIARRRGELVTSEEVADEEDVSKKYLDEILGALRQAGLLKAHRGPKGGYLLARRAAEISAADVVEALEGDLAVVPCLGAGGTCRRANRLAHHRGLAERCPARSVWQAASRAIRRELGALTLAELAAK